MASKLIGIVGATGTGKSTSIKHLNPKETYIINVAKKELPFKGSEKLATSSWVLILYLKLLRFVIPSFLLWLDIWWNL